MIVCKFGGTSVADARAITRLIDIVRARIPERPVTWSPPWRELPIRS